MWQNGIGGCKTLFLHLILIEFILFLLLSFILIGEGTEFKFSFSKQSYY